MSIKQTQFSASPSVIGYLYQCRYALLSALSRLRTGDEFLLHLETLDDVVFETAGSPLEILQTKHHLARTADLTDASADLWKTLRIWCESTTTNAIPSGTTFYLVTTSRAPDGSAASYLKIASRNASTALQRLEATAQTSTNKENRAAYQAFLSLQKRQREDLISSVYIVDYSPSIVDLDVRLGEEIHWAVESDFRTSFLERLEGWWFRRSIQHLVNRSSTPILSQEIEAQMGDLREQFKQDALPIDEDIFDLEIDDASAYQNRSFVHQLSLIGISTKRILFAIRDYFRAYEQRSRWVREDLLLVGELDRYEKRLVEEWERVFERMREELGDDAAEEAKQKTARELYKWVEDVVIPIRQRCAEPFVTRGSYHILSDGLRVGWHPDFMSRLQHLLERRKAVS